MAESQSMTTAEVVRKTLITEHADFLRDAQVIAHYLRVGAMALDGPARLRTFRLINIGETTRALEGPETTVKAGQPLRMNPGQDALLNEGVDYLIRRGAVRCLECENRLPGRYAEVNVVTRSGHPSSRRTWRDYCDSCSGSLSASRHKEAIRVLLDAVADRILKDGAERRRQRRKVRRQTA